MFHGPRTEFQNTNCARCCDAQHRAHCSDVLQNRWRDSPRFLTQRDFAARLLACDIGIRARAEHQRKLGRYTSFRRPETVAKSSCGRQTGPVVLRVTNRNHRVFISALANSNPCCAATFLLQDGPPSRMVCERRSVRHRRDLRWLSNAEQHAPKGSFSRWYSMVMRSKSR